MQRRETPTDGAALPARRLSSAEMEAVIRRAVELQTGPAAEEGVTEAEILRVGQDLGLAPDLVRRAIAEVRSRPADDRGAIAALMGPGEARAARVIRRPAGELASFLERYLCECEQMLVHRRLPDRTRYSRAMGAVPTLVRAARQLAGTAQFLRARTLDVAVSAIDPEAALVELSTDLRSLRTFAAVAGVGGGGVGGGVVAVSSAIALGLTPFALLGVPLLVGVPLAARAAYASMHKQRREELESFLDRLEHGDLRLRSPLAVLRDRIGL